MSAGFTKGPWPVERTGDGKRYVVGNKLVEGYYEVAEVYSDDCDPDEAKANAHLIAAAPDMYEALEECVAFTGAHGGPFAKARAALAKARGEAK